VNLTIEIGEYGQLPDMRLTHDQANWLQETGMIDVVPSRGSDTYLLKARSIVGVVASREGWTLRIRPKVPICRLVFLLGFAYELANWDEEAVLQAEVESLEVGMAEAFAEAAEKALRRGPRQSYVELSDDLMEFRGKVDVNRQMNRLGFLVPISVTFDDFVVDIPENQLILGAALLLTQLPDIGSSQLRLRLRRIIARLDGVRAARKDQWSLPVNFSRLNRDYEPAVALSRAVLQNVSFDTSVGELPVSGFNVNMNILFEKFAAKALARELVDHPGRLSAKQTGLHLDTAGGVQIIPDLTWMVDEVVELVLDTKYKDPESGSPENPDLYQMVAYCAGLGAQRAILIYPTLRVLGCYEIKHLGITIDAVPLDIGASLDDLKRQVAELALLISNSSTSTNSAEVAHTTHTHSGAFHP
jgi:5-methylcytosine-specific restriction enzyme subunit McrC